MKRSLASLFICISCVFKTSAQDVVISTDDILHFWEAYDGLNPTKDSVKIIQRLYIDKATPGFKDFIRARNFTASEYVNLIGKYPKFWISIRPNTLRIISRRAELVTVFSSFQARYPKFKAPRICFAIGCLRTGGTTTVSQILIGSEIAAADGATDKSEMKGWLGAIIGSTVLNLAAIREPHHHVKAIYF